MTNEKKIDLGLRVLVEGFNRRFQDIFFGGTSNSIPKHTIPDHSRIHGYGGDDDAIGGIGGVDVIDGG